MINKPLLLCFLIFLARFSSAQTSFTFNGNGKWTVAANWISNALPPKVLPNGSTIYISPSPGDSCVLDTSMVISPGASLIISPGAIFVVNKNLEIKNTVPVPRLIKAYEIDTSFNAAIDTINKWVFSYDSINRLVTDSFSNFYQTGTYNRITSFAYNGAQRLAFKKTDKSYSSGAPANVTLETTYCYFVNNKYDHDSIFYDYCCGMYDGWSKSRYEYGDGYVIRNFQNWVPDISYSATEYAKVFQTKVNGNIIHQIDTAISYANGQPQQPAIFETSVSYLPNPNPFYNVVYPSHKEYISYQGIAQLSLHDYAPAVLISEQTSTLGNVSYDYVFRPDGYPTVANVTYTQTDNSVKKTRLIFVYAE